ncbi:transposase [Stappia aggregata IAM 12614]|uniref:Transposase n=1 Tax=Roseibium aggregatum (strain ATCC 25650 / DSM 13394 / JCM 20685 / NBRC 16684 / NCIMB 2208 / IAM 12614 / B1) TaxID=384765 RepID=A0P0R1_ROSAI|nr:transposase [Stappia aggregata IAM 12614] [Roseibium aggregatum IAM 12614]
MAHAIRRACAVIRFDPTTYRYKSRRSGQAALEQRIREICQTRVRFGYVPALDPRFSYRGDDVVRTLETVCTRIGYLACCRFFGHRVKLIPPCFQIPSG